MVRILEITAGLQKHFINTLRVSIFIVMIWIGGLKAFQYEADGIVPFVANSPFMSFFYKHANDIVTTSEAKEIQAYKMYKNPEGKTVKQNIEWHKQNGTYSFSYGLGTVICTIGILVLLGIWFPKIGLAGAVLTFGMSLVTLSFLITTPEVYVPNLAGDFPTPNYGFPYLSGSGRLVLKDIIMLAGSLLIMSDSANRILKENRLFL
ncbi:YkgB family protein [Myroides marinus]|uniref:DUF417 family protein n=1 Tax=Myroides marinus TaxID=703342 RepID=UPI00257761B6|nr:DUF417 family protein [Myroides marinus]MDM1405543.1 YkgB family protein [Myroides marinus]